MEAKQKGGKQKMKFPFERVNWTTSVFLIGTLVITLTATPVYLWKYGVDWFQLCMFGFYFIATGMSITLGYHRLFSHRAFRAAWSVKLFVLLFGAAAFQNSALDWSSDHRRHHKDTDGEDDPYDISKGFFWAHIGWLLFKLKPRPPRNNVPDLEKEVLVMWQHNRVQEIAVVVGLVLPAVLGWFYGGTTAALGGFLLAGVTRVVAVQHATFFINSLCHTIGSRPYSTRCSARDSWIMGVFTFGEGYHNYHHEFQHDYRNGPKRWNFDPTKWAIWLLNRVGLAWDLRRVSEAKIARAEIAEKERRLREKLNAEKISESDPVLELLQEAKEKFQQAAEALSQAKDAYLEISREKTHQSRSALLRLKRELKQARMDFNERRRAWLSLYESAVAMA